MTEPPARSDAPPAVVVKDAPDEGHEARARAFLTVRPQGSGGGTWLLAFLPAFPIALLVLRVWYLSRQDLPTMLFVLQSANPLGMVASLLISLLWAVPAVVLVLRVLSLLLQVSDAPSRSWLRRAGNRTPVWVSAPAVVLAAFSWQLRFLPALLMLTLVIVALEVRNRLGKRRFATAVTGTAVPIGFGLLALFLLAPAVVHAISTGEPVTALLLLVPPLAAPLLCGPIPARVATWLLPAVASVLALATPVLLGHDYLNTPVLPRVAVQYSTPDGGSLVQRGSLVSVDDTFTSVLADDGSVRFVASDSVEGQVICSTGPEPPSSDVSVHGWPVEQSALAWAAPAPREVATDPRCRG